MMHKAANREWQGSGAENRTSPSGVAAVNEPVYHVSKSQPLPTPPQSTVVGGKPITQDSVGPQKAPYRKNGPVRFPSLRSSADKKVVGLKNYGLSKSTRGARKQWTMEGSGRSNKSKTQDNTEPTIEELETIARRKASVNPFRLLYLGNLAALKVMVLYLVTLETVITCCLTVGLTLYWYFAYDDDSEWTGSGLDFILLAFAVTSPISAAIGMAFQRRERALITIADFKSYSYHVFVAHCCWDWDKDGRARAENVNWVEHCDAVLAQLIGIGDELSRFLTLPTPNRSRHKMTSKGRREAARTMQVAYHLLESMTTQRITRLMLYSERLKRLGLPPTELGRLRQFERFLSGGVEQLRMVKMYRTPQALRSFARLFTLLLPPFYAPMYAQVARDVNSLGVGITFGIITALGLTALFESLQVLEDPFTAFLALDGIDVREEFEVLLYAHLVNTRNLLFPGAPPYPHGRRAALTTKSKPAKMLAFGIPPMQGYHYEHRIHSRANSAASVDTGLITTADDGSAVLIERGNEVVDGIANIENHHSFDGTDADAELGLPLYEEDETLVRMTAFAEDDEDSDSAQARRHISRQNTLRSRRGIRFAPRD